jgi:hypothetical protein
LEFVPRGYSDTVTRFDVLGRLVNRLRLVAGSPVRDQTDGVPRATDTYTNEQLQDFLHCWTLPGGTLPPDQARALLAWSETPDEERRALTASIAATEQQVEAKRLAPNQRRGHVSWLDRLKHVLGR